MYTLAVLLLCCDQQVGQTITVKWRGKPIFIRHRTKAEIDEEAAVNMMELRDQETDAARVQTPEWCVGRGGERGLVVG